MRFRSPNEQRASPAIRPLPAILNLPWVLEWLVWLLSLLLCGVIALVLALYDGQPYTKWHSTISLNALVSVFVTLFYMFVSISISMCISQLKWNYFYQPRPVHDLELFDQATQSVFGSLWLLVKRPKNIIASLAAFLALTVTAVGPFVQQIISLKFSPQVIGGATISVATAPLVKTSNYSHLYILASSAFAAPADTKWRVGPNCPAGANCTWDSFDSLTIEGECKNVTDSLQVETPCKSIGLGLFNCPALPVDCDWANDNAEHEYRPDCYTASQPLSLNYKLPNGISLNTTQTIFSNGNGDLVNLTADYQFESTSPKQTFIHEEEGIILADFTHIHSTRLSVIDATPVMTNGTARLQLNLGSQNVTGALNLTFASMAMASECKLRVVGRKMRATYIDGKFEEHVLGNINQTNSSSVKDSSENCVQFDASKTSHPLVACFSSNATDLLGEVAHVVPFMFADSSELWDLIGLKSRTTLHTWSDLDANFKTLADAVNNVAGFMTNFIREGQLAYDFSDPAIAPFVKAVVNDTYGSSQPPLTANGTATKDVLVYSIKWGWISLPASLVALVGVLILLTVVDTHRKGMPKWGSTGLANVLYAADDETRRLLREAEELGQLNEVAGLAYVEIARDRRGLVAVDVADSDDSNSYSYGRRILQWEIDIQLEVIDTAQTRVLSGSGSALCQNGVFDGFSTTSRADMSCSLPASYCAVAFVSCQARRQVTNARRHGYAYGFASPYLGFFMFWYSSGSLRIDHALQLCQAECTAQ
ncbi:hypothetical protein EJ04DRAFT_596739 [Polyplosphaeria fusca]|uniref:Uncharacterized protein n=1 Tax=Polyplosphaeria fusca TaxID=682080 RepID=A0A9P4QGP6_9PLEO|nr:hypothetical protein EJ04DRAFT_596739 [Polyplosphaeria fusca]